MGGSQNAGIGRYAHELLMSLLGFDTENYYKIFYHPQNCSAEDLEALAKHPNADLISANFRHYSISEQIGFLRLINKLHIDLFHFPNFNVPVLYKKPYVVTIHDLVHHRLSGHKKSTRLWFEGYKYVVSQAVKNSERIITVSQSAKREIVGYFPEAEIKTEVIYEGRNLKPVLGPQVALVQKKYLIQKPYFLFVGTLERKKNVPYLAAAFSRFIEQHRIDMELVIVGKEDSHHPEVKAEALDIKHKERVIFTNFVTDSDLARLYQGAYAFVTASTNEGFGLPGVEAMGFGLPVLCPDIPVFNEVYDNAGLFFDYNNENDLPEKMRFVCQDQLYYHQLREKSKARSEAFSWVTCAQKTLKIYENVRDLTS
ncbi:MAG TPA: glycosyltransferase family 1 protein [Patescibacteria group bacterium]|nr:glycosyltransferase family 1 protein [Patescibacteria group bacterium]